MIKIKDLSFSAFLRIGKILNTDQFELVDNGRITVKGELIPKDERTDFFLFELNRQIIEELSGLPIEYTEDNTFIEVAIDELLNQYNSLLILLHESYSTEGLESKTFELDGRILSFESFDKWTFNKWVTFENALKGKYETMNGESVQVEQGEKFVLPVCLGEWFNSMPHFESKFSYFNDELKASEVIPVFGRVNALVNSLKNGHSFIYSKSENEETKNKAFRHHADSFGWLETLRELSEKQVFGNYLQTKEAPMLEVLEFLNCSISKELANNKDYITNSKS